jgi:hypothetical protein
MGDKSNWKNKNRDIIKGAIEGVKKIAAPFLPVGRGRAVIKEAVGLEEAKKMFEGTKKISKNQKKFKTLTSPPSGSKIPMRIKVPKRGMKK